MNQRYFMRIHPFIILLFCILFWSGCEAKPGMKEFEEGLRFAQNDQLDQAIAQFNKVTKLNPDYLEAYYNRALVYETQGKTREAIAECDRLIKKNPGYSEAFYKRGTLHAKNRDFPKAIKDLTQAVNINHTDALAYLARAKAYYEQKDYKKSLEDVRIAKTLKAKVPAFLVKNLEEKTSEKI